MWFILRWEYKSKGWRGSVWDGVFLNREINEVFL